MLTNLQRGAVRARCLRAVAVLLILIAIGWGCGSGGGFGDGFSPRYPIPCFLLSGEHERQPVRVRAVYRGGFEESAFVDCIASTWVRFSPNWEERSDRRSVMRLRSARSGQEIEMVVKGHFECGGGYGHENMYSCEFTIDLVEMILSRVSRRAEG